MEKKHIAIIGLGYVGLPLAAIFSKKYPTIGYDIDKEKVDAINKGFDPTAELGNKQLQGALNDGFVTTTELEAIVDSNVYIITVPTDIHEDKTPNLNPLKKASEAIGIILKQGDLVIYESTTYPGCTEEICVPILESTSGLKFNVDFTVGYSPERINPGDKERNVTNIIKVTSGSTEQAGLEVNALYKSVITAGTYLAPSIKVAEAAKAIENAQRDVNISFMNELAVIFDKLDIDTGDVLAAAGTKWNFLPFKPGLVGGHCISVDPYYLAHKAQEVGHNSLVILSGRRINEGMGLHVASSIVKLMQQKELPLTSKALILGITFKENTGDTRNSGVVHVYKELKEFGLHVEVYDPLADAYQVNKEYGIELIPHLNLNDYKVILIAVAHDDFKDLQIKTAPNKVVYDLKGILPRTDVDKRL
ncbi:MAG TPA: Vi polysaccharide biosynthesis protein VipA/TviB [Cryomorphaceae bacterium]|nr:Vi polysaccharide biosynthesis protein VipA/TviB [Cryomorphaceae bacterium]